MYAHPMGTLVRVFDTAVQKWLVGVIAIGSP